MKTFLPAIILVTALIGLFSFIRSNTVTDQNANQTQPTDLPASSSATPSQAPVNNQIATIELEKGGIIRIQLFEKLAPKTVANFTAKANAGFYDNLTWHRVEDWVVQGGDPLGNGTGGGNQKTELSSQPFKLGAVGIARGGNIEISNDSQFFIVKKDSDFLNNQYTNFGQVTEGLNVIDALKIGDKIRRIRVQ